MKSISKFILWAILMVAGMGAATAQNSPKQRISREELADKQARHIADALALDEATTKRFVETYANCQKEVWDLGLRRGKGERHRADSTDEATGEALKAGFERQQQMLNIRQKYYQAYSQFLTQKQIKRVYELERQMMKRLSGQNKAKPRGEKGKMAR